jgi:predicted lipoprotein with Yx(FWY)xxD motif
MSSARQSGAVPERLRQRPEAAERRILVNRNGLTLYYWEQEHPGKIACAGGCAQAWPPLLVPLGVKVQRIVRGIKGQLGTIRRPEGTRQVTFNGRALYLYTGDKKPGDTNCQAQEGWYVIKTSGRLTGPSGAALRG